MKLKSYAFAILVVTAGAAQATTLYDNGGPNATTGLGVFSTHYAADDFTLTTAGTIQTVGFYAAGFSALSGWNQNFNYSFWSDAGGVPGSSLASGTAQNIATSNSGVAWCCGGNAFLVTFDLQSGFAAAAGTKYWLELTGAGGTTDLYWVTTGGGAGTSNVYYDGTSASSHWNTAFYLQGTAGASTPEPCSALLVGAGAAALMFARRKRA